jgi:hypothetical protein
VSLSYSIVVLFRPLPLINCCFHPLPSLYFTTAIIIVLVTVVVVVDDDGAAAE